MLPTPLAGTSAPVSMAMRESMAETHQEALESRPVNTKKSYIKKQAEFRKWCDTVLPHLSVETRYIVYGEKLHMFLKDEVR